MSTSRQLAAFSTCAAIGCSAERTLSGRRAAGDRHRQLPGRQPRLRRAVRADADLFPAELPGRGRRRRLQGARQCALARSVRALQRRRAWRTEPVSGFPEMATVDFDRLSEDDVDWADARRRARLSSSRPQSNILPPSLSLARAGQATELLKTAPRAVRRRGVDDHAASRGVGRRRAHSVFPDRQRPIWRSTARMRACSAAMAALRFAACRTIRSASASNGWSGRRLRDRQHPRRRRVRPGLAQGRHARRQEARA